MRVALALTDDAWWTSVDLQALTGLSRNNVKGTIARLYRWGYARRVENPDYDKGLPGYLQPGGVDSCPWLYRITDAGRAALRRRGVDDFFR